MVNAMKTKRPWVTVLVGLLLVPAWALAAEPSAASGIVAAAQGEAFVVRGEERLAARVGLCLQVGDVLETGRKARLKVLLTDDSVLSLGGETRLQVKQHLFEPGRARETHLSLMGGRARALVQQVVGGSRARFEVSTGTAVAGVRGTEFVVEREGAAERVVTLSGSVEWTAGGGEKVLVAAGEGSAKGGGPPAAVASAELERLRSETDAEAGPEALAWNLGPAEGISGRTGPAEAAEEAQGRDERQAGGEGSGEGRSAFGGLPTDGTGATGMIFGAAEPVGEDVSYGNGRTGIDLEAAGLVHVNVMVNLHWGAPRRGARR